MHPKLARFFKRLADLRAEDLEIATVQALRSKHIRVRHPLEQPSGGDAEMVEPLETVGQVMVDAGVAHALKAIGRPAMLAGLKRGLENGVDKSNNLRADLPRRRHGVTPWAGLKTM